MPVTISVPVAFEGKGSRTANLRQSVSRANDISPLFPAARAYAPVIIDVYQPVDPDPVLTIIPLEDCRSLFPANSILKSNHSNRSLLFKPERTLLISTNDFFGTGRNRYSQEQKRVHIVSDGRRAFLKALE